MRALTTHAALALALCITSTAFAAHHENKVTSYDIDASGGAHKDHWILFVSFDENGSKTNGVAYAAVGKGDTIDAAYGITYKSRVGKLGTVTVEAAATAKKGNEEGKTTVGTIKVSKDQYDAAKKVLAKWKDKTEFGESDQNASLAFSMAVMRAAGMKFPYTGLAVPHPLTFYQDIPFINRKMGKK